MTEEQDKSHRLLFSHPKLVAELIRCFVGGSWIERLDFETLEKVSERDLSPQLVRREKDLLWRLRHRTDAEPAGEWFYVYLHLEFQSEPQEFMALRMLTYKALLYEDLVRRKALTRRGFLPPVLSLVLYNGRQRWQAARSLTELVEPLPEFEALPAGFSLLGYQLIEERAYPMAELKGKPSPAAALFQLEQSHDLATMREGIRKVLETLPGAENRELREAFATWLTRVLIPAVEPGSSIPELRDLTEVDSMLQETVIEWRDGWFEEGREKGLREGRQKGRQEGRREGEAAVLLRQVEKKFGAVPATARARIESASADELLDWADRVLTAQSLDEVFCS